MRAKGEISLFLPCAEVAIKGADNEGSFHGYDLRLVRGGRAASRMERTMNEIERCSS